MRISSIYFSILVLLSYSCKENSKGKHLVSFPINDSQKVELLYFPGHATVQSTIRLIKIQGKNKIVLGKIVGLMDLDYDFEYKIIAVRLNLEMSKMI